MRFRDRKQRAAVCAALVDRATSTRGSWGPDGPTERAEALRWEDGPREDPVGRLLLMLAWHVWEPWRPFPAQFMRAIPVPMLEDVTQLYSAAIDSEDAIDAWLEAYARSDR